MREAGTQAKGEVGRRERGRRREGKQQHSGSTEKGDGRRETIEKRRAWERAAGEEGQTRDFRTSQIRGVFDRLFFAGVLATPSRKRSIFVIAPVMLVKVLSNNSFQNLILLQEFLLSLEDCGMLTT